jgi:exopolysaccharide production protein ExoY
VQDAAVSIPAAASSGFVHVWSHPLGGRPKRAIDIAVAAAALIAALPLMLVVALLIRLTCKGPVIFSHQRIGFNGSTFRCYKFRTMVTDAETRLQAHLAADPQAADEWRRSRKLKRDPRLTLLGGLLRKSSLDELPQLFNILRGDMSCVGPRPIVAEELRRYGPVAKDYLHTRPGLTGLWQVTGRDSVDYAGRVLLDAQYVRNWSMRTDGRRGDEVRPGFLMPVCRADGRPGRSGSLPEAVSMSVLPPVSVPRRASPVRPSPIR